MLVVVAGNADRRPAMGRGVFGDGAGIFAPAVLHDDEGVGAERAVRQIWIAQLAGGCLNDCFPSSYPRLDHYPSFQKIRSQNSTPPSATIMMTEG